MQRLWCGLAAFSLAALIVGGATQARAATASPALAVAYVTPNGQVAVLESVNGVGSITNAGLGADPVWSPNGANLLFVVTDALANKMIIYVADTHGANIKAVVPSAYPGVIPSWSPDSNYVVYTTVAPGTKPGISSTQLQIDAVRLSDNTTQVLGQYAYAAGCPDSWTALQDAFRRAQGAYLGNPTTLIWAQPKLVVAQSSCTGHGLTLLNTGSKTVKTLSAWSAGTLSPDGKSIAAVVAGAKGSQGQVGIISVASGSTTVLAPKISPASVAWSPTGKTLYAISDPSNPQSGFARLYSMGPDGKALASVFALPAAGIFHLSVNSQATHMVMSVVASAAANASSPPSAMVSDEPLSPAGVPSPFLSGTQASWRP